MPADLHLFSTPGEDDIEWVVDAARPYLERRAGALLAHLPLAQLSGVQAHEQLEKALHGAARVVTLDAEMMELAQMEAMLREAAAAYVPGGNTFLLNHRLHASRLMPYVRKKLQAGLPYIGVSAGAVLCGPNILTSNDLNMVPTPHFEGLGLTPFNFNMHYTDEARRDNWLADYAAFHDNAVVLMEDGAYVRVRGRSAHLVRGRAWVLHPGHEKERLESGADIEPFPEAKHG